MSEQNILNATQTDPMNPDYGYTEGLPEMRAIFQARGGRRFTRQLTTQGRRYQLLWGIRSEAQAEQLRQWAQQYRDSFFSYQDFERARYFSGCFDGPLQFSPSGNNQWNMKGDFVELPGLPMFAYPSNWARDGIILEEQDDFGVDLVKLTGAAGVWDRRTKNYLLYSQDVETAPWANITSGGVANPVVTADAVGAPDGTGTADLIAIPATTGAQICGRSQLVTIPAKAGQTVTLSCYLKVPAGAGVVSIVIQDAVSGASTVFVCNMTTAWQRFSCTLAVPVAGTGTTLTIAVRSGNSAAAVNVHYWGGQFEYGAAPSTYTSTGVGGVAVALTAPLGHALEHGGFGYWHPGTNAVDAAEWLYFGYGFQLYAPTNVDMGIMQVSCTAPDGTVEVAATNVDLYSAASVASAALATFQNLKLGMHRVKLAPTNTRNGASSANIVIADAIGVMR